MITEQDINFIKNSRKSPKYFIYKIWGLSAQQKGEEYRRGEHFTWQQNEILTAVEKALVNTAPKRISIRSGHGIGKSTVLAWLILWFLFCFKDAQIPATAPTTEQIHDILWKEINKWMKKMRPLIADKYEWQSGYVRMKESPETWFARAKTARKESPEALAGVHGDHVMFIIDEASGVAEEIFNTAEGALTNENILVLMISNATRNYGYFYDSHHRDKENWQTLTFNSEESPIVSEGYIQRIETLHGRKSDEFRIRVQGEFPAEEGIDDQGYVPLLVDEDLREDTNGALHGRIRFGIDPAGDGDDKAAHIGRDAYVAKTLKLEDKSTPKSIARDACELMKGLKIDGEDTWVDNFGEGANVASEIALYDREDPIRVHGVNMGDEAEDPTRFLDKRAECAWRMRSWIKAGGQIYQLDKWKEELLSLRYRRTEGKNSRIQLMPKRMMKKLNLNHGKSPNRVDGLMLTFFEDEISENHQNQYREEYEAQTLYGG